MQDKNKLAKNKWTLWVVAAQALHR
jgi:hypothetical protein